MDLPIDSMEIFHSYASLPEGNISHFWEEISALRCPCTPYRLAPPEIYMWMRFQGAVQFGRVAEMKKKQSMRIYITIKYHH